MTSEYLPKVGPYITQNTYQSREFARDLVFKALANSNSEEKQLTTEIGKPKMTDQEVQKAASGIGRIDGNQVAIPHHMTPRDGARVLMLFDEEQKKEVTHKRKFPSHAWQDVAVQVTRALRETFGWASGLPTASLFGEEPPSTERLNIGYNEAIDVIWDGRFALQGWGVTASGRIGDARTATHIIAELEIYAANRYTTQVNQLFNLVEDKLAHESIFRGQAINTRLEFIDPETFIDPKELVFDEHIHFEVEASVFLPIREWERMSAMGLDPKRGVLLAGPYGTGKTLTAMAAAWQAHRSGWTFLYIPSDDAQNLSYWMEWATTYAPVVLFMEDVDAVASERDGNLNSVLNTLDGLTTKGRPIMTILTTNHLTNIHPSLLRPGRLDALIKLDLPSAEVRAKMLAHYADAEPKTDWLAAAEACHDTDGDGYPGAAIREVAERADRYAYLAGRSLCTTDDLISVAHSMRAHIDLTKERAAAERPQLDLAMRDIINSTTKGRAKVKISD